MTTYPHRGVVIDFDSAKGKFTFTLNGEYKRSASLDGAKAAIDKVLNAAPFEPFKALLARPYGRTIEEVEVIGIHYHKGRKGWNDYDQWKVRFQKDQRGYQRESYETTVIRDTPENRALIKAWFDANDREEAEKARLDKLTSEARAAIPYERVAR